MRTAQQGDTILVHYVKRLQDGSVASSREGAPLQMTIGVEHRRLPGLGLALVGLSPGAQATIKVPPEKAYGLSDPARIRRWSRSQFPPYAMLRIGRWVRFTDTRGKRRHVRILGLERNKTVVVDTNHRWAGQSIELEVELLAIGDSASVADIGNA